MDFSTLTDDQLVELVRAACAEAVSRGMAVEAAVRSAMLSEADKAKIATEAAQREADRLRREQEERIAREAAEKVRREADAATRAQETERQQKLWAKKGELAAMVAAVFGPGCSLTVWERDGEKRVYIDRGPQSKPDVRVEYYATGNGRNAPKTLNMSGGLLLKTADEKTLTQELCEKANKDWNSLKLTCDSATAEGAQLPAVFDEYKAMRIKTLQERIANHAEGCHAVKWVGSTKIAYLKITPMRLTSVNSGNDITVWLRNETDREIVSIADREKYFGKELLDAAAKDDFAINPMTIEQILEARP